MSTIANPMSTHAFADFGSCGLMSVSTYVLVDSGQCRHMSISTYVIIDSSRYRCLPMTIQAIVDIGYCRLMSMSTLANFDSCRCRFKSMSTIVIVECHRMEWFRRSVTYSPPVHDSLRQRSYHVENTASRPISEVKQRWVWSVLGWVTAWEHQMLLAFLPLLRTTNGDVQTWPSIGSWWCISYRFQIHNT